MKAPSDEPRDRRDACPRNRKSGAGRWFQEREIPMARRAKTSRNRSARATDDDASYESVSGAGGRPPGPGARRNVAPGALESEPEDYDEQNRRNVGGEGGAGIQTGYYEEDYGPGARGMRHPEFHTEPRGDETRSVLRRHGAGGATTEEFPTGVWSERKTTSRLRRVKSRRMRARPQAGRGVGVSKTRSGGSRSTRKPARTKKGR